MGLFDFLKGKKKGPKAPEAPKEGGVENLAAEAEAFADKAETFAAKAEAFAENGLKGAKELSDAVKALHRKKAHEIAVSERLGNFNGAGEYLEKLGMYAEAMDYFIKGDSCSKPEDVDHQLRVAAAMGNDGLVAELHRKKARRIAVSKEIPIIGKSGGC